MIDILIAYSIGIPTGFALCALVNLRRPRKAQLMSVSDAGRLGALASNAKRRAPIEAMTARLRSEMGR